MGSHLQLILASALLFLSISYAGVYKWVDDKGKVHYSTIPPAEHDSENTRINNSTGVDASSQPGSPELPELLFGRWTAHSKGNEIELSLLRSKHYTKNKTLRKKLDKKPYWFEHNLVQHKKNSMNPRRYLISAGNWSLIRRTIIWDHRKSGKGDSGPDVMVEAYIKKASQYMLTLVFMDGETIKYKRTYRNYRDRQRFKK